MNKFISIFSFSNNNNKKLKNKSKNIENIYNIKKEINKMVLKSDINNQFNIYIIDESHYK